MENDLEVTEQKIKQKAFHCEGGLECEGGFLRVIKEDDVLSVLGDLKKELREVINLYEKLEKLSLQQKARLRFIKEILGKKEQ